MTLPEAVHKSWRAIGEPGLVVAVSGGPDSVALWRALLAVRASETALVLAHLNHQLRGLDSDSDEVFVRALFEAEPGKNLHLITQRLDVAALATGANLEATARRVRYNWLESVARSHGLTMVATGHTASDQAETVLHRLLRGSGFDGLAGIAARRELAPGVEVFRPLLEVTREEVLAYLTAIGQPAREDASNADTRFMRNRIRHELLPLLAQNYNPAIARVLTRLALQASEVAHDEQEQALALLQQAELPRAGDRIILDARALVRVSHRRRRGVLRLIWQRERWPMGRMGFEEYQRLAELLEKDSGAHDLPEGVRAVRLGNVLQLGRT